jgi:hypothetical protein
VLTRAAPEWAVQGPTLVEDLDKLALWVQDDAGSTITTYSPITWAAHRQDPCRAHDLSDR